MSLCHIFALAALLATAARASPMTNSIQQATSIHDSKSASEEETALVQEIDTEAIYTHGQLSDEDLFKLMTFFDYANADLDQFEVALSHLQRVSSSDVISSDMAEVTSVTGYIETFVTVSQITINLMSAVFDNQAKRNMDESIEEIEQKLKVMYAELLSVEASLKSSVEFNTWMAAYSEWEQNIKNGEAKLVEVYRRAKVMQDEQQKIELFIEFISNYKDLQIETSYNILLWAATESSPSGPNMFVRYIKEKGCLPHDQTRLYLTLQNLLLSGAVQMSVYNFLLYADWDLSQKPIYDVYASLYDIRDVYYTNAWSCVRYPEGTAKQMMRDYIKTGKTDSYELQAILSAKLPLYTWSTVVYRDWIGYLKVYAPPGPPGKNGQGGGAKIDVELAATGAAYVRVLDSSEPTKGALAVLAYTNNTYLTEVDCFKVSEAETVAFFPTSFARAASSHTLSNDLCPQKREERIQQTVDTAPPCGPYCVIYSDTHDIGFMAAGLKDESDQCADNPCNNGGLCRMIPHTNKYYCECPRFTDGFHCEVNVIPGIHDDVIRAIASIRIMLLNDFTGVPDIVDVFYVIKELRTEMDLLQAAMVNDLEYNRVVSLAGNTWSRSSFIVTEYRKLMAGDISEHVFQYRLSRLDNSVYHTINTNDHLVLGTVAGQAGQDLLTTYKGALYEPTEGCSEAYAINVDNMKKQIILTDAVLTEVWIREKNYELQRLSPARQQEVIRIVQEEADEAVQRWEAYQRLWNETSCPTLKYPQLRNGCPQTFSYPGLHLYPDCGNAYYTSDNSVTCQQGEIGLVWAPISTCEQYTWQSWEPWSGCTALCDGGTMERRRAMLNETSEVDSIVCGTEDCCQPKFGKFQCPSAGCIGQHELCDGNADCEGREDEVGCNYLTSGTYVSLWTVRQRQYINGENTVLGKTPDQSNFTKFLIERFEGNKGDPIKSGDSVGFRYRDDPLWLSCGDENNRVCQKHDCSGSDFTNPSCTDEIFTIYKVGAAEGDLLYPYDEFGLKSHQSCCTDRWLSDNKNLITVDTEDCPGSHASFSSAKADRCWGELWKIILYDNYKSIQ